jgi:branched-chain amino acid transport system substrate-binding protein
VDHRIVRGVGVAVVAALALVGCSESESKGSEGSPSSTTIGVAADGAVTSVAGDGSTVLSRYAGANWFDGKVPAPSAADQSKDPVKVGFMNVDSGPIGAMPELHTSTDAAVEFINKELGGVGGRPIELVPCMISNPMSADEAQGCARKLVDAKVVAVLGGIGLSNGPALKVFEENGIPWVGGIPVNNDEMTSPMSFQFSGGSPGAFTGFAQNAVEKEKAKKVAILYAEYPSIESAAVGFGGAVAEALGAQVTKVSFPVVSQDYVTPVQKAVESNPDAIFVGAADLACAPVMQALADLKTTAKVYLVGSCADSKQIDKVGADKVAGFRFNIENRLDQTASDVADTEIYNAAMQQYDPGTTARSAATVSFRGAMNLWAVLHELGPDATSEQIVATLRKAKDRPSFDGHPYTCDGKQIPALPSMCASQQVIAELSPDSTFVEASDGWIDVPEVLRTTGIDAAKN